MRDQCMQTEIYSQTVMLWKESFNSSGKKIHQYQQNEQPPRAWNHWRHKAQTMP